MSNKAKYYLTLFAGNTACIVLMFVYFWLSGGKSFTTILLIFALLLFMNRLIFAFANFFIFKHINESKNPRREFWNLCLRGKIDYEWKDEQPNFTSKIISFKDIYYFFEKGNRRKILLAISKSKLRIQDSKGKFLDIFRSDIDLLYLDNDVVRESEIGNIPIINLIIVLKNEPRIVYDVTNIDYNIDELELIVKNFMLKRT